MNKNHWKLTFVLSVLFCSSQASTIAPLGEQWHCQAHDKTGKQWLMVNSDDFLAFDSALALCKKESTKPKTCAISNDDCEGFVNGVSTRALWSCTAFDSLAYSWPSSLQSKADNAIYSAKNRCHRDSAVPESCYAYLMTCKNVNPLK